MKKNRNDSNFQVYDVLSKIFEQQEEDIYKFTAEEKEKNLKKYNYYSNIYTSIENIPDAFIETTGIKTSIENYLEILSDLQGIENKKFYKRGFSDAINLILNCIRYNQKEI